MSHQARCLCGAVRITVDAAPVIGRACWCRLCQYLAAGSATVNVVFPADAVRVEGEVRWHESVADSGNHMSRGFCPNCGTPLLSKSSGRPEYLIVRAGALDDPELLPPQATIWTGAAPAWACFDPDLPQFPAQPPPIS